MAKQKIAIIGLGEFGHSLALRLTELGVEVLGVDVVEERVEILRDLIAHTVVADTRDLRVLKQLGIQDFDVVIVAIGNDFEASILTTAHLQELKVSRVISRVLSTVHEQLLKLMKIHELIVPEGEAAYHLARTLSLKGVTEHLEISENYSIIEAYVPKWACGKSLEELDLRKKYKLNLITVLRKSEQDISMLSGRKASRKVVGIPDASLKFSPEDILVLFGHNDDIQDFLVTA